MNQTVPELPILLQTIVLIGGALGILTGFIIVEYRNRSTK